jgi:ketosteroid isomerase-like protein
MSVTEDTSTLEAANKELVRQWFALLSAGEMAMAAALVDPDATVWVPRVRKEVPAEPWFGGYQKLLEQFPDGLVVEPSILTAEDNRVAVIAEGQGTMADGRVYNNLYHWYIEADGSRITLVREYGDTLHAQEVLASPAK